MIKKQLNKGYTFIEILLYISISTTVLLIIVVIFVILQQNRWRARARNEVDHQGAQVIQILSQKIRSSRGIFTPSQGASGDILTLTSFDIEKNPTVVELIDDKLTLTEGSGETIDMTNSRVEVSEVLFRNLSGDNTPGNVRIFLTLSHKNEIGLSELEYTKTFYGNACPR
ncbi:hypothetical protein GF362_00285 [Candidatus Dojkabacteria bacterium]|nr:hypothetical protein [Candidatus Dojkabacteria bacterium]